MMLQRFVRVGGTDKDRESGTWTRTEKAEHGTLHDTGWAVGDLLRDPGLEHSS